ncbi:MAG: ORF6N domain-containing protein [Treponema sp.]|nr:ORF6N domain-containing protein [Treponema sp.]
MNELPNLTDKIYQIRDRQVMVDSDLAQIYQVETKRLNEAVKRNIERFPPEFMFQLTLEEYDNLKRQIATSSLRSQIATSKAGRGGRAYLPFVFTEHGVVMLSSVLNSKIATGMNIAIVKAFIDMRRYLANPSSLRREMEDLKQIVMLHMDNTTHHLAEHTEAINNIIDKLTGMIETPPKAGRKIGFGVTDD